jgi:hypothetical protein
VKVTDEQLRALVRDAVARHLGQGAVPAVSSPRLHTSTPPSLSSHPSHVQYLSVVNVGDACVIEPSVSCDHCGYCRSHGH